jgi:hypothetical protein
MDSQSDLRSVAGLAALVHGLALAEVERIRLARRPEHRKPVRAIVEQLDAMLNISVVVDRKVCAERGRCRHPDACRFLRPLRFSFRWR